MTPRCLILTAALGLTVACGDTEDRDANAPAPIDRTAQVAEQPVMIGFDGPRFNACGRYGRVTNLAYGETALAVRAAPASSAAEVDRLDEGTRVAMCQRTGGWIGIVYPHAASTEDAPSVDGEGQDVPPTPDLSSCGIAAPISGTRTYDGPCRSGWVSDNNIRLVSGRQ